MLLVPVLVRVSNWLCVAPSCTFPKLILVGFAAKFPRHAAAGKAARVKTASVPRIESRNCLEIKGRVFIQTTVHQDSYGEKVSKVQGLYWSLEPFHVNATKRQDQMSISDGHQSLWEREIDRDRMAQIPYWRGICNIFVLSDLDHSMATRVTAINSVQALPRSARTAEGDPAPCLVFQFPGPERCCLFLWLMPARSIANSWPTLSIAIACE